jgi:hypothetical protein
LAGVCGGAEAQLAANTARSARYTRRVRANWTLTSLPNPSASLVAKRTLGFVDAAPRRLEKSMQQALTDPNKLSLPLAFDNGQRTKLPGARKILPKLVEGQRKLGRLGA